MVGFPLLLIPLAVYNIIVFLMPGVSFTDPVVNLTLMSGAEWQVTLSDILLALGILLLLFEVIKGAPGAKFLTDHLLSLSCSARRPPNFCFGRSSANYCPLACCAGFPSGVALRTRRGAALAPAVAPASRSARRAQAEAPAAELHADPAPAPTPAPPPASPVPGAASAAESVLPDPSEPTPAQPAVPSPGLQPGSPSPDTPQR
jgi:hypothetical protein